MLRVFYGIPIPCAVVKKLTLDFKQHTQQISPEEFRKIETEFWHITVKFFCSISPDGLAQISKRLRKHIEHTKAFSLQIKKLSMFPWSHSNVFAAIVKPHETLLELHRFLDHTGQLIGIQREARRYKPHITLAKFKSNRYDIPQLHYQQFNLPVQQIVLYESKPTGNGSQYIPLAKFDLQL